MIARTFFWVWELAFFSLSFLKHHSRVVVLFIYFFCQAFACLFVRERVACKYHTVMEMQTQQQCWTRFLRATGTRQTGQNWCLSTKLDYLQFGVHQLVMYGAGTDLGLETEIGLK